MQYSSRPEFEAMAKHGQKWATLYAMADFAYFFGLLGGITGAIAWLVVPVFRAAKGIDPRWLFFFSGFLMTIAIAWLLIRFSVAVMGYLLRRFDVPNH